ncbi:MAG: hypothetical protein U5N56_04640 [Candidatus Marinimicrobia bacterium]|nr:hypothetical protein [Candidatus Neomarinimicrobiota bacterium]
MKGDQEIPLVQSNYALRGAEIPAGDYTLTMDFHPVSYYAGMKVVWIGNIIMLLLIAGSLIYHKRKKLFPEKFGGIKRTRKNQAKNRNNMKKVLIITYYWPPAGGPGVQRMLKFARYLPEFGWEPVILTVENGEYPARDETLLSEVPGNIRVYRTRSFEPFSLYKNFSGTKKIRPYR